MMGMKFLKDDPERDRERGGREGEIDRQRQKQTD